MTAPLLKIIFMGTPDFSVPALARLVANPSFDVIAVYTQPPRPAGRGQQLTPSPIHKLAEARSIPVYTPKSLKRDPAAVEEFKALNADIAIVAAYGLILPLSVLNAPKYGCLNIHASLLPRWRGAAPIQRAIEAGDSESGITIMKMEEGLDTGPMLSKKTLPITSTTTAQTLHDGLSALGGDMIETILLDILKERMPTPEIQDDEHSNYAPMLKKEEGLIDWSGPAQKIDFQVRALTPWPGCYSVDQNQKRVKILSGAPRAEKHSQPSGTILSADGDIACGDGIYRVTMLQPENSKAMDFRSALNGKKFAIGDKLGA